MRNIGFATGIFVKLDKDTRIEDGTRDCYDGLEMTWMFYSSKNIQRPCGLLSMDKK